MSAIFIIGILIAIILSKPSQLKKDIIFGNLFYLFTIFLVLQIIPVGGAITAERYSYIPYIGLVFAIGKICLAILDFRFTIYDFKLNKKSITLKPVFISVLIVTALIFSITTYSRNKVWKNGVTLFTDVIEKYPEYAEAYLNRANAFSDLHKNNEAINDYSMALQLSPDYAEAYNYRGLEYYALKKYELALSDYNMAIKFRPDYADAFKNRGIALFFLQKFDVAVKDFNMLIKLKPENPEAFYNRGFAFINLQNFYDAIRDFDMAVKLKPAYAEAYNNRGIAYFSIRKPDSAIDDFSFVIRLKPGYADAFINRGIALANIKKYVEAVYDWETAIKLNPENETSLRELINNARNQRSKEQ